MLDRFHPPVEEYLEAIFSLEEEGIPVIQARLAEIELGELPGQAVEAHHGIGRRRRTHRRPK